MIFSSSLLILSLGSTFDNVQQMQGLLKKLDKNGDGKITIDDIQLLLQGLGLGSVSPC
jgi:Ca2+-binding EF-hand superfamily protein